MHFGLLWPYLADKRTATKAGGLCQYNLSVPFVPTDVCRRIAMTRRQVADLVFVLGAQTPLPHNPTRLVPSCWHELGLSQCHLRAVYSWERNGSAWTAQSWLASMCCEGGNTMPRNTTRRLPMPVSWAATAQPVGNRSCAKHSVAQPARSEGFCPMQTQCLL